MASIETGRTHNPEKPIRPEYHKYTVVMPYSENLNYRKKDPTPRLSFYSAFVAKAALELYKNKYTDKLILCGEQTFGQLPSTTDLMKRALIAHGVPENDIIIIPGANKNTIEQIKGVAKYQKDSVLEKEDFGVIVWKFHEARVANHMKGLGVNGKTVIAEDTREFFESFRQNSHFNIDTLYNLLPAEMEKRERILRWLSTIDKPGYIPQVLGHFRGPAVTDILHDKANPLPHPLSNRKDMPSNAFVNTTGEKRLIDFYNTKKEVTEQISQPKPKRYIPFFR